MEFEFKGYSEADQGQYHKKMQALFKRTSLHLCHGLYMISTGSKSSSWKWPWQKIRQKKFGFIDVKGKKPSFYILPLIVLLIYCIQFL
jgi:hypothetical protein